MSNYYRIKDKGIIGRQDSMFDCSIFQSGKGWVPDKDHILMDRIIGYEADRVGSSSVMELLEPISEAEALSITK
jgi:hypothetical protein